MKWNAAFESRPPRILFLADRNILVDDPMNKDFSAFDEDKIYKIQKEAKKGRDLYLAIFDAPTAKSTWDSSCKRDREQTYPFRGLDGAPHRHRLNSTLIGVNLRQKSRQS